MIAHLKGRLESTGIDHAVIDVGGVGYLVGASSRTLAAIGPVGEAATLFTEMLVGEDFIRLVGFASAVSQDVPPFMLVDGNPLAVRGFNIVGLRRRDFSAQRLAAVKQMHRLLYRQGKTLDEARAGIAALAAEMPEAAEDIALMESFIANSTRGIAR